MVAGGFGLARVAGGVVLVSDAAPHDVLDIEIVESRRGVHWAVPREVRAAGPGRRVPPCPHAAVCGGCDFQHLGYEAQIEAKLAVLREAFRRTARLAPPEPIRVHRSPEWGYRRRARFHLARDGGDTRLGFRGRRSHAVVAIGPCPVLVPELERELPGLGQGVAPHALETSVLLSDDGILHDDDRGRVRVRDVTLWVDGSAFFQANVALVGPLVDRVLELAGRGERALDLYAGVGLFATALRHNFSSVTAVEGDARAGGLLSLNLAGRSGTEAILESVEGYVRREPRALEDATVVADPPREGLAPVVRAALGAGRPGRVVYVSCDPATLARDAFELARHGLRLSSLDLFDLFPQTHHQESVALFERAG